MDALRQLFGKNIELRKLLEIMLNVIQLEQVREFCVDTENHRLMLGTWSGHSFAKLREDVKSWLSTHGLQHQKPTSATVKNDKKVLLKLQKILNGNINRKDPSQCGRVKTNLLDTTDPTKPIQRPKTARGKKDDGKKSLLGKVKDRIRGGKSKDRSSTNNQQQQGTANKYDPEIL